MLLDIQTIRSEGLARELDLDLELPDLVGDRRERLLVGPARLRGTASPGVAGVDLEARMDATVSLPCSRCLEPVEIVVARDFYLNLIAEEPDSGRGPGEVEIGPRDTDVFHAPDGKADLAQIATEQVYLNLPLKPVCGEQCRGLCPTCGANRNRIQCECGREDVDPRLAPLLDFKKKREDRG